MGMVLTLIRSQQIAHQPLKVFDQLKIAVKNFGQKAVPARRRRGRVVLDLHQLSNQIGAVVRAQLPSAQVNFAVRDVEREGVRVELPYGRAARACRNVRPPRTRSIFEYRVASLASASRRSGFASR